MKKITRRNFLKGSAAVAAAGVLAACSSSDDSSETEAATEAVTAGATEGATEAEADADAFADAPIIKIQFAENQQSTGPLGEASERFCEKLAERTNNTVQMEFYGDALLGDEVTVVGAIEMGTIEFTRVNLASMQSTVPEVGVLTMPYLYRDSKHCYDVLNSDVAQDIMDKCQEHGFMGLRYLGGDKEGRAAAFRCFYAPERFDCLADLQGKKIRVQETEIMISTIRALGGVPTPMDYGEVFQALQTGVVDMAENDPSSYYSSGHYEVAPYYVYDNHQISPSMYLMSQKCYDSMTDAQLQVFLECLDEYIDDVMDNSSEQMEEYIQRCKDAGCEFIEIDTTEFQEACQTVYDEYPEYADYIERIREM